MALSAKCQFKINYHFHLVETMDIINKSFFFPPNQKLPKLNISSVHSSRQKFEWNHQAKIKNYTENYKTDNGSMLRWSYNWEL